MRHGCHKLLTRQYRLLVRHFILYSLHGLKHLQTFQGRMMSNFRNDLGDINILHSNFLEQGGRDISLGIILLNCPLPRLVTHLWDRAALRVCADGGANRLFDEFPKLLSSESVSAVQKTYLPDLIVGDMDSIRPAVKAFYNDRGVQLEDLSHDQMTTDLTKAIMHMEKLRQQQELPKQFTVIVLGGIGGRLDHTLGNLSSLHAHRDTRIVLCGDNNIVKLVPKGRSIIRPYRNVEGPHCGLVPYKGPATGSTSGLRWNLENTYMEVGGFMSTCNVMDSCDIQVDTDADLLWMAEYNDAYFARN